MKKTWKLHIFPLFSLIAGGVGLGLRIWLMETGIDQKGLLIPSHPANSLTLLLTAFVLLALLLCVRQPMMPRKIPKKVTAVGCGIAATGIFITNIQDLLLRRDLINMITCFAGILAMTCMLYLGYTALKKQKASYLLYGIITIYLMLHPVTQYRNWSTEPQLQDYIFELFCAIFLMLASYHRTTLSVRQGSLRWYLFCSQTAIFFCCMCLNTNSRLFYLSMGIWMATMPVPVKKLRRQTRSHTCMYLPEPVRNCIKALEQAGHTAYVVGGCVRDSLLHLTPHDYDLCTSATPEDICQIFADHTLVRSGEKHGTIGVVTDNTVYEITTFRTEGGYTDSRHPDWVRFVPTVEEDLARRDFTINAMAYHPVKGYIDPFGGMQDLESKTLRAVGDPSTRFTEDALRILRGVRFAVRFGLTPEETTAQAMEDLAPLMDHLAYERVFDELCKLLPVMSAQDLLRYAPIVTQAIPELAPTLAFDQRSPHHAYDLYTHIAHVVEAVPPALPLRWAALLHDIGKVETFTTDETGRGHFYGHAQASARMANEILLRLKAPTVLREQVVFLIAHHMSPLTADKPLLRRQLGKHGEVAIRQLLILQKADFGSKGTGTEQEDAAFDLVKTMLGEILQEQACLTVKDLEISGNDLIELGFAPGPQIGTCLQHLLTQVQEERIPNQKEALLAAAAHYYSVM